MTSPSEMRPEESRDVVASSQRIPMFKKWLQTRIKKSNKDPVLHKPDRDPGKPPLATDHQSRPQSPARVEELNVGPSTMAATRRVPVSAPPG